MGDPKRYEVKVCEESDLKKYNNKYDGEEEFLMGSIEEGINYYCIDHGDGKLTITGHS